MRKAILIESTVILKVLSNEVSDFDGEYGDFEGAVAILIESTVILKVLSNEISGFDREHNHFEGAVE